jgi:hypothetical protein
MSSMPPPGGHRSDGVTGSQSLIQSFAAHAELTRQRGLVFATCSPLAYRGDLFRCQCPFAAPVGSLAFRPGYPFALALSD